jgi:hypothetical protein
MKVMEDWRMKRLFKIIFLLLSLNLIVGCNGGKMETIDSDYIKLSDIKDISATAWNKLGGKKIFFGHQSVGRNIFAGIGDIITENPDINLNIMTISEPMILEKGVFAHANIGKNREPQSKIDAFASYMENGIGHSAEIAFFKFCYVDVVSETDVQELFTAYKTDIAKLKNKFPETTIVHFTVPLKKKYDPSLKQWIKDLLKRSRGSLSNEHNVKRNEFNDLIISEYNDSEPVFDIAKLESVYTDGSRETFSEKGKIYYSLVPEYTDDGGHLNEKGRKIIAEQLLIFLANLSQ